MFTGIVECLGTIVSLSNEGSNLRLGVKSSILEDLKVDQSISHNGICLTVEKILSDFYEVVAVAETLEKTNLNNIKKFDLVNLERCMKMNDRLDGHIVQGHVDGLATVARIEKKNGSWIFECELEKPSKLIVEKGSVCINGVSLTAFSVTDQRFCVTIIPYTFEHTTFKKLSINDQINIEFDIIGKYIQRMHS